MRITPLAVWASALEDIKDVKAAVIQDAEFTHPNQLAQEAIFIYVAAVQHLLKNPKGKYRARGAFGLALTLS